MRCIASIKKYQKHSKTQGLGWVLTFFFMRSSARQCMVQKMERGRIERGGEGGGDEVGVGGESVENPVREDLQS